MASEIGIAEYAEPPSRNNSPLNKGPQALVGQPLSNSRFRTGESFFRYELIVSIATALCRSCRNNPTSFTAEYASKASDSPIPSKLPAVTRGIGLFPAVIVLPYPVLLSTFLFPRLLPRATPSSSGNFVNRGIFLTYTKSPRNAPQAPEAM